MIPEYVRVAIMIPGDIDELRSVGGEIRPEPRHEIGGQRIVVAEHEDVAACGQR